MTMQQHTDSRLCSPTGSPKRNDRRTAKMRARSSASSQSALYKAGKPRRLDPPHSKPSRDRPGERKLTLPLTVPQHYNDCKEQCFEAPRNFNNMAPAPGLGIASAPVGFQQWPSHFDDPLRFDGPGHFEGPGQPGPRYDMPHQGGPQHLENFPGQQSCVEFNPQHNLQPSMRLMGPPIYENPMAPQENFPMAPQRFPEAMNPFPHHQWLSVAFPGQQNIQQAGNFNMQPQFSQPRPAAKRSNPEVPAISLQQPVMENMNQPFLPQHSVPFPQQSIIKPTQPEATLTSSNESFSAPPAVPPVEEEEEEEEEQEVDKKDIPDLTDFSTDKLKQCYESVVTELYSGKQCSQCSMRFNTDQTKMYADHLDWHFKKNQASKKVMHRGWYCSLKNWIEFEEITDPEKCTKSQFFEKGTQKKEAAVKEKEFQSARATKGQVREYCETCQEPFEIHWVEEEEDWFLKNAVKVDNKNFHPMCFIDYKNTSS